jgi:NitT/TauT family transport system substrate-binding protein
MQSVPSKAARPLVAAALLALGCAMLPAGVGAQAAPETILVGASSDDVVRPLLYAVDAGLFKKAGLDVQLVKLANGAAVAAAVAGGSIQLGKGSALTPVQAYAKGIPFIVTANLADYTSDAPNIAIVVQSSAPIHGPKDLVGKTIGMVGLNDSNTLAVYSWLEKAGVDLTSVKFIELGNSAGAAALEANRVDAMMFLDPALSAALTNPNLRILGYPNDALGRRFSIGTVFGLAAWVNAHRDEVARFNRALSAAEAYVGSHENETKALAANYAGLDLSQLQNIRPPMRTTGITNSDLQIVIDAAAKYKFIPKDFNANDLICDCAVRQK